MGLEITKSKTIVLIYCEHLIWKATLLIRKMKERYKLYMAIKGVDE